MSGLTAGISAWLLTKNLKKSVMYAIITYVIMLVMTLSIGMIGIVIYIIIQFAIGVYIFKNWYLVLKMIGTEILVSFLIVGILLAIGMGSVLLALGISSIIGV